MAAETRAELLAALRTLSDDDREVLGARFFLDLSEAETADALGIARGTVKSRTSRALARLRELTQDEPPYVAAFFMAGQQLTRLGRIEEARAILRDGVEAARSQNNDHAAGEMAEFLAALGDMV